MNIYQRVACYNPFVDYRRYNARMELTITRVMKQVTLVMFQVGASSYESQVGYIFSSVG